jgi:hypothetical protein
MKYLKMLGLAVVAAAALMAFVGAGTASAKEGVLCSTTSNPCNSKWAVNTVLDFSLKSGSSAKLVNKANGETLDTCTGTGTTVLGDLTANPDATGTATGKITKLIWEKCTFPTTTVAGSEGALKVERIAGTSNGTVRSDAETRVTINTILFGTCVYGVKAGAHLGVITEGKASPEVPTATFKAEGAEAERLTGSQAVCPEKSLWTAEYVLTTPEKTTLSVSSS